MTDNVYLEIRPVTGADEPAILEVYRDCEDFLALGPVAQASAGMVRQDLETSRAEGGTYCAVFGTDRKMMGVVDFVRGNFAGQPNVAFFSLLMISKPFRRRGLGAAVVKRIEREIRQDPRVDTIQSAVQVNNPDALWFWQRNGYVVTGVPELRPDTTTVHHLAKMIRRQ